MSPPLPFPNTPTRSTELLENLSIRFKRNRTNWSGKTSDLDLLVKRSLIILLEWLVTLKVRVGYIIARVPPRTSCQVCRQELVPLSSLALTSPPCIRHESRDPAAWYPAYHPEWQREILMVGCPFLVKLLLKKLSNLPDRHIGPSRRATCAT
jgi:hypothetical protein